MNKQRHLPYSQVLFACFFAALILFGLGALPCQAKNDGLVRKDHLNNQLFKALEKTQKKVVALWLEARASDGAKKKSLQDRALKLQESLAADVKKMKERFRFALAATRQKHKQALENARPELTPELRAQLEKQIEAYRRLVQQHKDRIAEIEDQFKIKYKQARAEYEKNKAELYTIHEKCQEAIIRQQKEVQKLKKQIRFIQESQSYETPQQMVNDLAGESDTVRQQMNEMLPLFKGNEKKYQGYLAAAQKELERITKAVAAKDFRWHPMGYSVKEWREGFLEPSKNAMETMLAQFRRKEWLDQAATYRSLRQDKILLAEAIEKLGGNDATVKRYQQEMAYLSRMLRSTFIPEVPEPKKFLDYLCDGLMGIGQVVNELGPAKEIYDLVTMGNPWKIVNFACEKAYGKGVVALLVQKTGLDKYVQNKYVKMAIEGKFDLNALKKEVAGKVLPPDVVEKLKAFEQIRKDPQKFIKGQINDQLTAVVEANPMFADTIQKFQKVKDYMKNPDKVQKEIERAFLLKLKTAGQNQKAYQQLNARYKTFENNLKSTVALQQTKTDDFKKKVATTVNRVINASTAMQYVPDLMQAAGRVEQVWQTYIKPVQGASQ